MRTIPLNSARVGDQLDIYSLSDYLEASVDDDVQLGTADTLSEFVMLRRGFVMVITKIPFKLS